MARSQSAPSARTTRTWSASEFLLDDQTATLWAEAIASMDDGRRVLKAGRYFVENDRRRCLDDFERRMQAYARTSRGTRTIDGETQAAHRYELLHLLAHAQDPLPASRADHLSERRLAANQLRKVIGHLAPAESKASETFLGSPLRLDRVLRLHEARARGCGPKERTSGLGWQPPNLIARHLGHYRSILEILETLAEQLQAGARLSAGTDPAFDTDDAVIPANRGGKRAPLIYFVRRMYRLMTEATGLAQFKLIQSMVDHEFPHQSAADIRSIIRRFRAEISSKPPST